MRQIKFRQFDKRLKEFMFFELNNGCVHIINSDIESFDIDRKDSPQEQFTGLTDKNNIDIYEGDIIKHNDRSIKACVVSLVHGCWMAVAKNGDRCFKIYWHLSQVEVIGNIHQNGDMINDNS